MKTPHLLTPHRLSVVLLLAVVGVCAPSARAALGGPTGVVIPYAGKLELDGALVTGLVDFEFGVAPAALQPVPTTPVDCRFTLTNIPVTNGEFAVSIVIPAIKESCVKGKDVHLEVRVARAGGTLVLLGKQRVTPVVAAATSGVGDFHVAGALSAGPTTVTGNLVVTGSVSVACRAGFTAIDGGRICISTNMQGPAPMQNDNFSAIRACRRLRAHVCTHTEIQDVCGNFLAGDGLNPYAGIGADKNLWYGELVADDSYMLSPAFGGTVCQDDVDNQSAGPVSGATRQENYRCCH